MRHPLARFCTTTLIALIVLAVSASFANAVPTLTVAPPDGTDGWYRSAPQVAFTADAGYTTRYQWNGSGAGSWIPYASPFIASHGLNLLSYQFLDALGDPHLGTTFTRQFSVDSDMPSMTAIAEQAGRPFEWHGSATATFTWSAEDDTSGIADYAVTFDGVEATTAATMIVKAGLYTGEWQIAVKARDRAGNWGDPVSLTHLVDLTAPSVLAPAFPEYEGGPATITVIAFDSNSGVSKVETKIDSGAYVDGASRAVSGIGSHTLYYRATDVAGNVSGEQSVSFEIVPLQAPVTTTEFDEEAWYTDDVTFSLEATDSASGVRSTFFELDGIEYEYPGEVVVAGQGVHPVRFWSVDNLGCVETPKTVTVRIDMTPPQISATDSGSFEGTAVCSFSATDGPSGLAGPPVAASGGSIWWESPARITQLGSHTITVNATDRAGHTTQDSRQVTVIANEPPSTSISGLSDGWVGPEARFSLEATDNQSGVASMHFRLDGGDPFEYFADVAITKEGTTAITYWSADMAGNVETESEPVYAYVDGTWPVTISDVQAAYTSTATITLASSDAYTGVREIWYQVDAGDVLTYERPFEVSKRGVSTLSFGAVDRAGNAEPTRTATFVIGKWETALSARVSAANAKSGSAVTVTGRLTYPPGVVAGMPVTLWASVASGRWTKVGSASFDASSGVYRASRRIYGNQRLQLRFAGDEAHASSNSPIVSVGCVATIARPVTPWINYRGRSIVVYGAMWPRHAAGSRVAKLHSYRWEGDQWVLRQVNTAYAYRRTSGSKYGAIIRLPRSGRWRIVAVHQDSLHARSVSAGRVLYVR